METISCLEDPDRNWNGWKKVMDKHKHFEAKHTVMGESRGLKESIVMLNTQIS